MTHRRFIPVGLVALAFAAATLAPAANASGEKYDGYKSGYPTLRALHASALSSRLAQIQLAHDGYVAGNPGRSTVVPAASANAAGEKYDGYKSGYPTLRALHATAPGSRLAQIQLAHDGYVSGNPGQATVAEHGAVPSVRMAGSGFHWSDAAVGAVTATAAILLIGVAALMLSRRRLWVALKP